MPTAKPKVGTVKHQKHADFYERNKLCREFGHSLLHKEASRRHVDDSEIGVATSDWGGIKNWSIGDLMYAAVRFNLHGQ